MYGDDMMTADFEIRGQLIEPDKANFLSGFRECSNQIPRLPFRNLSRDSYLDNWNLYFECVFNFS